MKKAILLLAVAVLLASFASAAIDVKVFSDHTPFAYITCNGCTVEGGASSMMEIPETTCTSNSDCTSPQVCQNGNCYVASSSDLEYKCGATPCTVDFERQGQVKYGKLKLQNAQFKVLAKGPYSGIVHEIKSYQLANDKVGKLEINGMKVEITNGVVIDFWDGKTVPSTEKNKLPDNYFDEFTYRLDTTTKPAPVKNETSGKIDYDKSSAYKATNTGLTSDLKVPNKVFTVSRKDTDQEKFPVLSICGQKFYNLYSKKIYGKTAGTSTIVQTKPNSILERQVVEEWKNVIKVKKDNSAEKCAIQEYIITPKNKEGESLKSFNELGGANFCGVYFSQANNGKLDKIKCKYTKDNALNYEIECDKSFCDNIKVGIPTTFKDYGSIENGVSLFFIGRNDNTQDNNPLNKIKISHFPDDGKTVYSVNLESTSDKAVRSLPFKVPNGLVFYKTSIEEREDGADIQIKSKVRTIGINKLSKAASPGRYVWMSTSPGWAYSRPVWIPPTRVDEKKAIILTHKDSDEILIDIKGGSVSIEKEGRNDEFILSNSHTAKGAQRVKDFKGYTLTLKNQDIIEIEKFGTKSEEKVIKVKDIVIRELKVLGIIPATFRGVFTGSGDATGGTYIYQTPTYVILTYLEPGEKTVDSLPKYIWYIAQYKETIRGILDKFGPCSCSGQCSTDDTNKFIADFKKLNPEFKNAGLNEIVVTVEGTTKRLKIPTSGSTFSRPDVVQVVGQIGCVSASKAITKSVVRERAKLIKKINKGNKLCIQKGGFCTLNTDTNYKKSGQVCTPARDDSGRVWKFSRYKCGSKTRIEGGQAVTLTGDAWKKYQCCQPVKPKSIRKVTKSRAVAARAKTTSTCTNAQCKAQVGEAYHCENNKCQCSNDGCAVQFRGGYYCDSTVNRCKEIPQGASLSPSGAGLVAQAGGLIEFASTASYKSCRQDSDCSDNKKCKVGYCVHIGDWGNPCISSEDCRKGEVCDTNKHKCIDLFSNTKDTGVIQAGGLIEFASTDSYKSCRQDSDCSDNKKCKVGYCVHIGDWGNPCISSEDCRKGEVCDTNKHKCIDLFSNTKDTGVIQTGGLTEFASTASYKSCRQDSDCSDNKKCKVGYCVHIGDWGNPCISSEDCRKGEVCDTNKHKCIDLFSNTKDTGVIQTGGLTEFASTGSQETCRQDSDCGPAEFCHLGVCFRDRAPGETTTYQTQLAKVTSCIKDTDCPASKQFCVDDVCVTCRNNDDCESTKTCYSGVCSINKPSEDTEEAIQASGYIGQSCTKHPDCGMGEYCDSNTKKCADLFSSTEYTKVVAEGADYNLPRVPPLACSTDLTCVQYGGGFCQNGFCVGCRTDTDCGIGELCDQNLKSCVSRVSAGETVTITVSSLKKAGLTFVDSANSCKDNAACTGGQVCRDGKCKYANCHTTEHCMNQTLLNHVCVNGKCYDPTNLPNVPTSSYFATQQLALSDTLFVCTNDRGCTRGQVCKSGTCRYASCRTTADCINQALVKHICVSGKCYNPADLFQVDPVKCRTAIECLLQKIFS